jgi:hypothetical protein
VLHAPPVSLFSFYQSNNIWWVVQIIKLLIMYFLNCPVTSSLLGPYILFNTLFWNHLSVCSSLSVSHWISNPHETTGVSLYPNSMLPYHYALAR